MKKRLPLILSLVLLSAAACDQDSMFVGPFYGMGSPLRYDDSEATRRLKVAAVAMECSLYPDTNFTKMVTMISKIKQEHPDVRLIVFGETTLGWYYKPDEAEAYQRRVAKTIPGAETDSIGRIAQVYDIYIVFGLSELRGRKLYNSQVLINPGGEIEALHSKHDLISWDVLSGFSEGTDTAIVQIDDLKCGMIICADINSRWVVKGVNSGNVDVVIHSLANLADTKLTIDPNARRFDAWEIFANRLGQEDKYFYDGQIYISDPVGNVRLESAGHEGYVFYDLGVY